MRYDDDGKFLSIIVCLYFFKQLYRKKPGMTMNAARLSENIPKNRYRDISPCKFTFKLCVNSIFLVK